MAPWGDGNKSSKTGRAHYKPVSFRGDVVIVSSQVRGPPSLGQPAVSSLRRAIFLEFLCIPKNDQVEGEELYVNVVQIRCRSWPKHNGEGSSYGLFCLSNWILRRC